MSKPNIVKKKSQQHKSLVKSRARFTHQISRCLFCITLSLIGWCESI